MITHTPKEKPAGPKPGEIHAVQVRILAPCKAEVIQADGKHQIVELGTGDVVKCPIWSARDLVARRVGQIL